MRYLKNEQGVAVILELLLVAAVLIVTGVGIYTASHRKSHTEVASTPKTTRAPSMSPTPSPTPNPYAGWKTYTVPEATNISFKYPADWTVIENLHDTVTTPFNRFVKILAPNKLNREDFVFRFWYSPGTSNTLTQSCHSSDSGNVKTEAVTISGKPLSILTSSTSDKSGTYTGVAFDDSSKCYIAVPSGVVKMHGGLGSEDAPYITPVQWNSRPEPAAFDLIFKSLEF